MFHFYLLLKIVKNMYHLIVLLLCCWSHSPFRSFPFQVKSNSRIKQILLHLQVTRLSGANVIASSASSYLFIDLFYTSIVVWGFWPKTRPRWKRGALLIFLPPHRIANSLIPATKAQPLSYCFCEHYCIYTFHIYIRQPTGLL